MKQLKLYALTAFCMMAGFVVNAQIQTSTFDVAGNCSMCKSKIEKAAKDAGANFANWSPEDKKITVKYDAASTTDKKIQEAIAKSGFDNAGIKAKDKSYNRLSKCCQYNRNMTTKEISGQVEVKDQKIKSGGCKKSCCAGKGE